MLQFVISLSVQLYKNICLFYLLILMNRSSLDRQVTERVNIENFHGQILMNRRNELGGVRIDRMQYRRWGGQWERCCGGHQTLLKERGSSSSIRGGGTLGGEEERGSVTFTFTFHQGKWKWMFYHNNCLSCLDFIVSAWYGLVAKVLTNEKWDTTSVAS